MLPGNTPALFGGELPLSSVDYLVVAGGGGGAGSSGSTGGGGGGAGGMLTGTLAITPGNLTVTVGAGGAGGPSANPCNGGSGGNSLFHTVTATGGGGGGFAASASAGNGGSGGGAAWNAATPGTGIAGQGNNGGANASQRGGAGGGGKSAVGANGAATGGAGGAGAASSISGASITYAGGGGGGGGLATAGGAGGAGGGGAGGNQAAGSPGTDGLGGGGGSAGQNGGGSLTLVGGKGGSGIVIISYPAPQRATGGTVTTVGANVIHTFTSLGFFSNDVAPPPVLLLHMDGANGSAVFTDASPYARGNATVVGNAQVSTAQSKFGGASALFDGTGDYLSYPTSADFDFGAGDFAIDAWIRITGGSARRYIASVTSATENGPITWGLDIEVGGQLRLQCSFDGTANNVALVGTTVLALNTWYHVAATRAGNVFRVFVDGVLENSVTISGSLYWISSPLAVGTRTSTPTATPWWVGYIEELRISKGIARWTANFTPPTGPY